MDPKWIGYLGAGFSGFVDWKTCNAGLFPLWRYLVIKRINKSNLNSKNNTWTNSQIARFINFNQSIRRTLYHINNTSGNELVINVTTQLINEIYNIQQRTLNGHFQSATLLSASELILNKLRDNINYIKTTIVSARIIHELNELKRKAENDFLNIAYLTL